MNAIKAVAAMGALGVCVMYWCAQIPTEDPPPKEIKAEVRAVSPLRLEVPPLSDVTQLPQGRPTVAEVQPAIQMSAFSPGARVSLLTASKSPSDWVEASRLINACKAAKDIDLIVAQSSVPIRRDASLESKNMCRDITPGQLSIASNLAEQAFRQHAQGAANEFVASGADGRPINEVWNDPAYSAWKDKALSMLEADAMRGDRLAIYQLIALNDNGLNGDNPEKVLTLRTLDFELARKEGTKAETLTPLLLGRQGRMLNESQQVTAITNGKAIFQQCCRPLSD